MDASASRKVAMLVLLERSWIDLEKADAVSRGKIQALYVAS